MTLKKDNERNEELLNMKKAWETFESGRAEKAMKSRQKFLDSLRIKPDEQAVSETTVSEPRTDTEVSNLLTPPVIESPVPKQTFPRKKSPASGKKGSAKEEPPKPIESISLQVQTDEPLLDQPPPSTKPKLSLPPLDIKSFIK